MEWELFCIVLHFHPHFSHVIIRNENYYLHSKCRLKLLMSFSLGKSCACFLCSPLCFNIFIQAYL